MPHEKLDLDWREHLTNPEDQDALADLERAGVAFEWRKTEHSNQLEQSTQPDDLTHALDQAVTTNAEFVALHDGRVIASETDMNAGSIEQAVRTVIRDARGHLRQE